MQERWTDNTVREKTKIMDKMDAYFLLQLDTWQIAHRFMLPAKLKVQT